MTMTWPLLHAGDDGPTVEVHGPRRWWGGVLDVEGLAVGSVASAVSAISALCSTNLPWPMRVERVAASFTSITALSIDGVHPPGFAEMSGFYRTADGWIRVHANYPHHRERLQQALSATTRDEIQARLGEMSCSDAEREIRAVGGIAAAVRSRAAWVASEQHRANRDRPWICFEESTDTNTRAAWTPRSDHELPLSGMRVLDLTRVIAGPSATRFMAALGADVLRVDPPHLPELQDQHVDTGFGKRSALADLRRPESVDQVHELLTRADVLFLGYRRHSLAAAGLTAEQLRERHPHLVVVTLDAWGSSGPMEHQVGFDSIVQAAVGIADDYRKPDGSPGALPLQALDHASGYGMVTAAAQLLAARARGEGAGSAQLSLARTADRLYAMTAPDAAIESLQPVETFRVDSAYGHLEFVPPPVDLPDRPLAYPSPPSRYGADELGWRPRTR
ncbi:CoA transferase [Demetria terragena]|uniref:CoA transferase n=1 Tax=Demetria terragena TaxID=63959 RepID=UPI0003675070|nr:CoA transferase [Demetria terragena]